jgi:hypothetical protein
VVVGIGFAAIFGKLRKLAILGVAGAVLLAELGLAVLDQYSVDFEVECSIVQLLETPVVGTSQKGSVNSIPSLAIRAGL